MAFLPLIVGAVIHKRSYQCPRATQICGHIQLQRDVEGKGYNVLMQSCSMLQMVVYVFIVWVVSENPVVFFRAELESTRVDGGRIEVLYGPSVPFIQRVVNPRIWEARKHQLFKTNEISGLH